MRTQISPLDHDAFLNLHVTHVHKAKSKKGGFDFALSDLRQQRKLTYIMVTHNLAVVTHLCAQIGVMQQGEMVEQLSAEDLRARRIQHPHTAELFDLSLSLEEPA